jgi:hypothetical protein
MERPLKGKEEMVIDCEIPYESDNMISSLYLITVKFIYSFISIEKTTMSHNFAQEYQTTYDQGFMIRDL